MARGAVLVIDNYDSFTQNVSHMLTQLGVDARVIRNDALSVADVQDEDWGAIVVSPGPGRPRDAGISLELVRRLAGCVPILGICLGHQVIAQAFGGRIVRARRPLHGTAAPVHHAGRGILRGLSRPFAAALYHSLAVSPAQPGRGIEVTALSEYEDIMAIRHERYLVEGVQFHPESYLTPAGPRIFHAFLRRAGLRPLPPSSVVR